MLTIAGSGTLGAGTVAGGTATGGGTAGAGLGTGVFLQGNETLTLSPGSGQSLTIAGTVADESGSTVADGALVAGQGTGTGAGHSASPPAR